MRPFAQLVMIAIAGGLMVGCSHDPGTTVPQGQTGATASAAQPESIDQSSICQVSQWQSDKVARTCTPGQKVIFLPHSWGNEQLPILFAGGNCDLRYSVALTNGGVTCIFRPFESVTDLDQEVHARAPATATPAPAASKAH